MRLFLISLALSVFMTVTGHAAQDTYLGTGRPSQFLPIGPTNPLPVAPAPYPAGSTPITAVGTGTTGAVVATLAASTTLHTYICSVDVSAIGGTAAVGPVTITNLGGNTFTYQLAATASGNNFTKTFSPCVPTSAINTAIVITTTADGTASAVDVNAVGYQY